MKYLIVGDLHIRDYSHIHSNRINDVKSVLNQIIDTLDESKITKLILTGDIFHSRFEIDTFSLDIFNKFVSIINEMGVDLFIVPGNHDMMTRDNSEYWFKNYPMVKTIEKFETIGDLVFDGGFAMIPYSENKMKLKSAIKELTLLDHVKFIVGHFGIDKFAEKMNFTDCHAVYLHEIPSSKLMILGHYHEPASIKNCNIHYIGTPYATTFGEAGIQSKRKFMVIETDDKGAWIEETVPVQVRDLISCTALQYRENYTDAIQYPYVKITGELSGEIEAPNIVSVKTNLKTKEEDNSELRFKDLDALIDSYFKSRCNSPHEFRKVMMTVNHLREMIGEPDEQED